MGRIRRSFDIQFKLKVCEAIDSGERSVLDVCREFQIQRPVVEGWFKKFLKGDLAPKEKSREGNMEREIEKLRAKVGELTMQLDAAKKTLVHTRSRKNERGSIISGNSSDLGGLRVRPVVLLPAPTTTTKKGKH